MFSRYQGEQVQAVPPGYLESAQAQAAMYANIGQTIAKSIGDIKQNELKSEELSLKKGENAEAKRKNDLYERKLNTEENTSFIGEIEKISTLHQKSLDAIDQEIGTIDKEMRAGQGKLAEVEMKTLQSKMDALRAQRGSIAGRMHDLSTRAYNYATGGGKNPQGEKPAEGQGQGKPNTVNGIPVGANIIEAPAGGAQSLWDRIGTPDITKPRADHTGFIPTNYLNGANVMGSSGNGVVSTYTTNGMGGAPKKVVVQDGRVHSVIGSSGKAVQLSGFLPEQSISAAEEYAQLVASEQPVDASNTEDPHQFPATPEAKLEEQAMPAPLKQSMYRIPVEGLKADPKSGNEQGAVHGTIEFLDGKPRVMFNWDLLDPVKVGPKGAEGSKQSLRMLTMMNYILSTGQDSEVETVSDEEFAEARRLFHTENNGNELPRIARAYALAIRDTAKQDSPESNRFGLRFRDEYGMWPTEFLIKGEQDNDQIITPSVKVLNEENVAGVLGKVREAEKDLITISQRPEGLELEDPSIAQIRKLKAKRDFAMDTFNGPGSKKQKDEALKEIKALDDELKYWESESRTYQARVQQWNDSIKAQQAKIEAAKGPITTQKTLSEIESNEQHTAKVAKETLRNFFPQTGKEIFKYGGWMPAKLQRIKGFSQQLQDSLGRNYKWSLQPSEVVDELWKNNRWKDIERISAMLPTQEQWTAIDTSHKSAIGAIVPLNKLKEENDKLVRTWVGPGGVVQTQYKKLTDNELADAETMRAAIIKDIRVALVGPGNPSNYEQEILRTIVPDPKEFFSNPQRNSIRLKALTLLVILNHAANMRHNGMDMPDKTVYDWYNQAYGKSLGEVIDAKTFANIFEDYSRASTAYKSNEAIGRATDQATSFGDLLLKRLEEAEAAKARAK